MNTKCIQNFASPSLALPSESTTKTVAGNKPPTA
jgi:hypothetical protein